MLDLRFVAEHLEEVRAGLARRSPHAADALAPIAELASERKRVILASESKAQERNHANEAMAKLDKKSAEFAANRERLKALSGEVKELEKLLFSTRYPPEK